MFFDILKFLKHFKDQKSKKVEKGLKILTYLRRKSNNLHWAPKFDVLKWTPPPPISFYDLNTLGFPFISNLTF